MLPFKKILFPVDFSQQSIGAAHYVEAFAGRFDAELTLLHVIEPPNYNDALADSPARRRERLDGFLAKELAYFKVERIVALGEAASNILSTATAKHADLIMMPTHGHGAFRRFLLGSVTAKVLHDADCPVWTGVHLEQAPPLEKIEFRQFLCAANLEPHVKTVVECASEFANEYRANLTILHAAQGSENIAGATQKLEQVLNALGAKGSIVVQPGEPAHVVASAAALIHADLLVIGRSPAPGIFGRLRTHAYPIIRQSPCPVISV
jgi:nucleotide-binding universal stress UspA family protein